MSLVVRGKLTPKASPPRAKPTTTPRPQARAGRMLALAHHIEDLVERGMLRDYADAARALGITRARMTQIINLLLLAPAVQERLLMGEVQTSERRLRGLVRQECWQLQLVT